MSDKRKVATDALETLGTIINEAGKRDAIHLAVEPTVAGEKLYPGQDVGVDGTRHNPVGIVDPFLKEPVKPGERFWLVVYPRQIDSLRHVWTHPAFKDEPVANEPKTSRSKIESAAWLSKFLADHDCADDEEAMTNVIAAATSCYREADDQYLHVGGTVIYGEISPEFWDHVEILTGEKITARNAKYFSCSC